MIKKSFEQYVRESIDTLPTNVLSSLKDPYSNEINPFERGLEYFEIEPLEHNDGYVEWTKSNTTLSKTLEDTEDITLRLAKTPNLIAKTITGIEVTFDVDATVNYVGVGDSSLISYCDESQITDNSYGGDTYLYQLSEKKLYDYILKGNLLINIGLTANDTLVTISNFKLKVYFANALQTEADIIYNRLELCNLQPLLEAYGVSQEIYYPATSDEVVDAPNDDYGSDEFQEDSYVPEGWSINLMDLTQSKPVIYSCKRYKNNGEWEEYSSPVKIYQFVKQGEPVQFEYIWKTINSAVAPEIPSESPSGGVAPSGWSTSMSSVSEANPYCYMTSRTKIDGLWKPYGETYKEEDGEYVIDQTGKISLVAKYSKETYNVILGNETQALKCDAEGIIEGDQTISIPFKAFKGIDMVTCTMSTPVVPEGMVITNKTHSTPTEAGNLTISIVDGVNLTGDAGTIELNMYISDNVITKLFTWSKAKDGADGADGVNGADGEDGVDGVNGLNGADGNIIKGEEIVNKLNEEDIISTAPETILEKNTFAEYFATEYKPHGQFRFYKQGNLIHVKIGHGAGGGETPVELGLYRFTQSTTDWQIIDMPLIAEEYRPPGRIYIGNDRRDNNNYSVSMRINTGGTIETKAPSTGTYSFAGNCSYAKVGNTQTLLVPLNSDDEHIGTVDINYGEQLRFKLTSNSTPLPNQSVFIIVNNVRYNKITDENGEVGITIKLERKTVNFSAGYGGDLNYAPSNTNTYVLNVSPATTNISLVNEESVFETGGKVTYQLNPPLSSAPIKLVVNGITYNKETDETGKVTQNINLNAGKTYSFTCKTGDSSKFTGSYTHSHYIN